MRTLEEMIKIQYNMIKALESVMACYINKDYQITGLLSEQTTFTITIKGPFGKRGLEALSKRKHYASLHLTYNQHKSYYLTVAEAIEQKDFGYAKDDWVSEEQIQKAIATNDCWTLQWPSGFYKLSAADLDVLLESARNNKD